MGIRTVAVHSDVDVNAKFVADESYNIGGAAASESYPGDRILQVAKDTVSKPFILDMASSQKMQSSQRLRRLASSSLAPHRAPSSIWAPSPHRRRS